MGSSKSTCEYIHQRHKIREQRNIDSAMFTASFRRAKRWKHPKVPDSRRRKTEYVIGTPNGILLRPKLGEVTRTHLRKTMLSEVLHTNAFLL